MRCESLKREKNRFVSSPAFTFVKFWKWLSRNQFVVGVGEDSPPEGEAVPSNKAKLQVHLLFFSGHPEIGRGPPVLVPSCAG